METKEQIEKRIRTLCEGEYLSMRADVACLDGHFDQNQLREIADAMDKLKELDLSAKSGYNKES